MNDEFSEVFLGVLLPGEAISCTLYVEFKNNYIPILKEGEIITFDFLCKMKKNNIFFAFVNQLEITKWELWRNKRLSLNKKFPIRDFTINATTVKKIASFKSTCLSYFNLTDKYDSDYLARASKKYSGIINEVSLRWYFENDFTIQSVLHSAKTSFMLFLFTDYLSEFVIIEDRHTLILFSMISNLETPYTIDLEVKAQDTTLNYIKKNNILITREIMNLLGEHQLFYNNSQNNNFNISKLSLSYRIFSVVDNFESERVQNEIGTRSERVKSTLEATELYNIDQK
ncbi:MAG: hypothetical protein HOJ35_03505, partial [Bdellovibrionales bacterium]|nr:hypothetical protein [Bdellovibrionales bacterium]